MASHLIPTGSVGIGLRSEHCRHVITEQPAVDWFEVHSENYFGWGGAPHDWLKRIRQDYNLSFHGVGLSLGSTDALNLTHLKRLGDLVETYQPALVSEHLSWSSINGTYLHDLLPLPFTKEAVFHLADRIYKTQEFLGRTILVENASTYLEFSHSEMFEWDFINEITRLSGCKLLLDVNNVYVNACNHQFDPMDFFTHLSPPDIVQEIHLAGHTVKELPEGTIRIDTHDRRVCKEVWNLYESAIQYFCHAPTLIEWDKDLPEFSVLLDEAEIARSHLHKIQDAIT